MHCLCFINEKIRYGPINAKITNLQFAGSGEMCKITQNVINELESKLRDNTILYLPGSKDKAIVWNFGIVSDSADITNHA